MVERVWAFELERWSERRGGVWVLGWVRCCGSEWEVDMMELGRVMYEGIGQRKERVEARDENWVRRSLGV